MCSRLVAACLLVASEQAFVPAPIQWGGDAHRFFIAPIGLPDIASVPNAASVPAKSLVLLNRVSGISPVKIPHFTTKPDQTITLDSDWCIEAAGTQSGDVVRVSQCIDHPSQKWNWVPTGHGLRMIQLKSTNMCLDVADREVGLKGALIKLRECDGRMTQSWQFEGLLPLPDSSPSRRHVASPYLPHVIKSSAVLTVLGVLLSLSVSLWQRLKAARAVAMHQPVRADHGGVSLAPLVAHQDSASWTSGFDSNARIMVSAVMALSPLRAEAACQKSGAESSSECASMLASLHSKIWARRIRQELLAMDMKETSEGSERSLEDGSKVPSMTGATMDRDDVPSVRLQEKPRDISVHVVDVAEDSISQGPPLDDQGADTVLEDIPVDVIDVTEESTVEGSQHSRQGDDTELDDVSVQVEDVLEESTDRPPQYDQSTGAVLDDDETLSRPILLPYRLLNHVDIFRPLLKHQTESMALRRSRKTSEEYKYLAIKLGRKPTLSEMTRHLAMSTEKHAFDQYNFHLNALSVIRLNHDRMYYNDAFPSEACRTQIETLPALDLIEIGPGYLNGRVRQRGPNGGFVARIAEPLQPKSHYLQNCSKRFTADVFEKLDYTIQEVRRKSGGIVLKEDFHKALGLTDPNDIDEHSRILVKLGLQVVRRQDLGEPHLSSGALWARIMSRTDEIYQVAEPLRDAFQFAIHEMLRKVGADENSLALGSLKDPVRLYEKAADDYSNGKYDLEDGVLAESWVFDVIRGGVILEDAEKIIDFQRLLSQAGVQRLGGNAPHIEFIFLRSKNKFAKPGPTHFRYILNNFAIIKGKLTMVCELQVHHSSILVWDAKLESHYHYDFLRAAITSQQRNTLALPEPYDWDADIERRLQEYEEKRKVLFWYDLDQSSADEELEQMEAEATL